jgi:basic membrane protein A
MKKSQSVLLSLLVLASVFAAQCGGPAPAELPKEATKKKVKIALVMPGSIDDLSWSQGMYEGIMKVQEELGKDVVEVAYSEKLWNQVDAAAAIRDYASDGFDIVIAHGAQYQNALLAIAPDFPNTSFAYGTASKAADNVFAYDPQAQEGAYLLGMMAGKMTRSNVIGIVGPVEAGDAIKFNRGFVQGVKDVNPVAEVAVTYSGSLGDTTGAAELARSHMNNGADVLTGTAQQSVGAIQAASERKGVIWFGHDVDQSKSWPDTVAACQVYDWPGVIKEMLDYRARGVKGGKVLSLSFANGRLGIAYNDKVKVPDDVKATVKEKMDAIAKGEFVVKAAGDQ